MLIWQSPLKKQLAGIGAVVVDHDIMDINLYYDLSNADENIRIALHYGAKGKPVMHEYKVYDSSEAQFVPSSLRLRDIGDYGYISLKQDDENPASPAPVILNQNHPNPFNPSTQISFYLSEGNVNIDPMFRHQTEHSYSLLGESPMIDMGSPHADALDLGCLDIAGNERFWDGNADDIARIDIGAYEYQNMPIPVNLSAHVGENSVELTWDMPGILRALSGFRVYRNDEIRAELSDPAQRQYTDAINKSGYYSYYITAMYGLLESDHRDEVLCYIEVVDTEDLLNPPDQFSMLPSPNPFHDHTTLRYFVPKAGMVKIDIYNLKGQLVKSLVNEAKRHGNHEAIWDGCDQAGNRVSCGLYFARLHANGGSLKRKVIKLK